MEGLRYIWRETTIFLLLGFSVIYILLAFPYQMMLPIFTDDILKVGATGLGLLQGASGMGALITSLALASLPGKRRGFILLYGSLLLSLALLTFSFSHSWPLSLLMMFIVGIGQAGHSTAMMTLLPSLSSPEYLGRVMSILMMNVGLSSLGTFFVGILAEGIGVKWAVGGFAAVLILLCVSALFFVPRIRKLN
jgi:MFS family permease